MAGTAILHLIGALTVRSGDATLGGWFAVDPLGHLILGAVSVLFTLCALYGVEYLRIRKERANRVFCVCLLTFLSMATAITVAQHLAVVWVAVEGATLSTAILIYFNHNARSLEAAWKYLMIGSVGIALALLGSLFVAYAALHGASGDESLLFGALLEHAGGLSRPWLRAGFVLLLVGYGTKMGLAPMHTWKPDAYGEAPGIIGALLAQGLGPSEAARAGVYLHGMAGDVVRDRLGDAGLLASDLPDAVPIVRKRLAAIAERARTGKQVGFAVRSATPVSS